MTDDAGLGARLAWIRSGRSGRDTPSLLLAHGITDSAACWERVVTPLAAHYDVIRYDARGHGASDRTAHYLAEHHTSDLIQLVRALQLDRPVIIGHSMGGVHAATAASKLDVRLVANDQPLA